MRRDAPRPHTFDLSALFLLTMMAQAAVAAPSFDCTKASNAFEKAVCASSDLSLLDQQIADAYKVARKRLANDARALAELKKVQRKYIGDGDVFLQTRMENQLEFLRGIDGKPRQNVAGNWSLPKGGISMTPNQQGHLEISATTTEGLPPTFYTCEWEGSDVPIHTNEVSSEEGEGWTLRLIRKGSLLIAEDIPPKKCDTADCVPSYCTPGGKLSGVYFASSSVSDEPTSTAAVVKTPKYYIMTLMKALPVSAFDNTTDGLEQEEMTDLLERGTGKHWSVKEMSNASAVLSAIVPFSEVSLNLMEMDNQTVLEVKTVNQKSTSYSYWLPSLPDAPMIPYQPRTIVRVLN